MIRRTLDTRVGLTFVGAALIAARPSHAQNLTAESFSSSAPSVGAGAPGASQSVRDSYALPLGIAYAVPVSLEVLMLALRKPPEQPLMIGAVLGSLAPPIVHAAYDNGLGFGISLGGTLASLLAGGLVGGMIGIASGYRDPEADDEIGRIGGAFAKGAQYGVVAGYTLWAIADTALNAHRATPKAELNASLLLLPTLTPLVSRDRGAAPRWSGATLGVLATF